MTTPSQRVLLVVDDAGVRIPLADHLRWRHGHDVESAGGYAEALARVGSLLARRGAPLPLARLALKQELAAEYHDLLPDFAPDEWRRIRGEQDIIVRYEPEKAIAALPKLLTKPGDRERLVTLVRSLLADERVRRFEPTTEQLAMIENIGETLDVEPARARAPARKAARKPATRRRKSG